MTARWALTQESRWSAAKGSTWKPRSRALAPAWPPSSAAHADNDWPWTGPSETLFSALPAHFTGTNSYSGFGLLSKLGYMTVNKFFGVSEVLTGHFTKHFKKDDLEKRLSGARRARGCGNVLCRSVYAWHRGSPGTRFRPIVNVSQGPGALFWRRAVIAHLFLRIKMESEKFKESVSCLTLLRNSAGCARLPG